MKTVHVPELQQINPDLIMGLFEQIWPKYFNTTLGSKPTWLGLKDDFYFSSMQLYLEFFSSCVMEVTHSANLNRPFTLDYVEFDFNSYMDNFCYDCEDGEANSEVEEQMFDFLRYTIEKLTDSEFIGMVEARLLPACEVLSTVVSRFNIRGFWCEKYVSENNMWEGGDKIYAIEEGDYECLYYGEWKGYTAGTIFYQLTDGEEHEFYLYHGRMIQGGYGNNIIPYGEPVSMCRLNPDVAKQLDL